MAPGGHGYRRAVRVLRQERLDGKTRRRFERRLQPPLA
jgi:hypothetical protein